MALAKHFPYMKERMCLLRVKSQPRIELFMYRHDALPEDVRKAI
tara:strand:- start:700 stop:831 length:132 start_codon:yes stop_codon:yes gene_type:complete